MRWLGVALLALLGCVVGRTVSAQDVGEVVFAPRTVLVAAPFGLYVEPGAEGQRGLGDLSLVDVERAVTGAFTDHDRFVIDDRSLLQHAMTLSGDPELSDLLALAEQNARAGIASYRQFEMATAIDRLDAAFGAWRATPARYTDATLLADAALHLGLAWIQTEAERDEPDPVAAALAAAAFAELVRLDPTREPDPDAYPPSVLEPWLAAWARHSIDRGAALVATVDELRWLGGRTGVDLVVSAVALVPRDRAPLLRIRVFDVGTDALASDVTIEVAGTAAELESEISMAVADLAACLRPLAPPSGPAQRPARWTDLQAGYAFGTFLTTPTRSRFLAHGLQLSAAWTATRVLGVYGSTRLLFATRDPLGDLVVRLDTAQLAAGLNVQSRTDRFRLTAGSGLQVMRVGRVRATTSFWCRVSRGEPTVFDAERVCLTSDVTDRDPQWLGGFDVRAAFGVRAAPGFWVHLEAQLGLMVFPFDTRVVDFPVGGTLLLDYRF